MTSSKRALLVGALAVIGMTTQAQATTLSINGTNITTTTAAPMTTKFDVCYQILRDGGYFTTSTTTTAAPATNTTTVTTTAAPSVTTTVTTTAPGRRLGVSDDVASGPASGCAESASGGVASQNQAGGNRRALRGSHVEN